MIFNGILISRYFEANFEVLLLCYFFAWTLCLCYLLRFLQLWSSMLYVDGLDGMGWLWIGHRSSSTFGDDNMYIHHQTQVWRSTPKQTLKFMLTENHETLFLMWKKLTTSLLHHFPRTVSKQYFLQYPVHFSRQWHILRPSIQSVFQASRRSLIKFYLADATLSGPLSIPPA